MRWVYFVGGIQSSAPWLLNFNSHCTCRFLLNEWHFSCIADSLYLTWSYNTMILCNDYSYNTIYRWQNMSKLNHNFKMLFRWSVLALANRKTSWFLPPIFMTLSLSSTSYALWVKLACFLNGSERFHMTNLWHSCTVFFFDKTGTQMNT